MDNRIINYNEKKVIVARQVMILNLDSTPENVITEWEKMYPKDIDRVRDNTELFDWMAKFIRNNNVKSCNALLARVRNKREKILRTKCKYIGYGQSWLIVQRMSWLNTLYLHEARSIQVIITVCAV